MILVLFRRGQERTLRGSIRYDLFDRVGGGDMDELGRLAKCNGSVSGDLTSFERAFVVRIVRLQGLRDDGNVVSPCEMYSTMLEAEEDLRILKGSTQAVRVFASVYPVAPAQFITLSMISASRLHQRTNIPLPRPAQPILGVKIHRINPLVPTLPPLPSPQRHKCLIRRQQWL